MTLGGLAVAVGRVVDDAIVVLENIYRHRALGEDRLTASINGPREVAGAITASTLTTVARVPAARLRRRPRQPVLPAVRADRHVRAARVAGLRADGRAGPRLPVHRQGHARRSTRTASRRARSGSAPTRPRITFALRSRWTKLGRRRGRRRPVLRLAGARRRCCRPSSSTPAPRRSSRSPSRRRPARAPRPSSSRPIEAEDDPRSPIADVELVQTSIPGEGDTSFQTIVAALTAASRPTAPR